MRFPNAPRAFIPPRVQRVHPPGTDAGQGADPWLPGAAGTPQPPRSRGFPAPLLSPSNPRQGPHPGGDPPSARALRLGSESLGAAGCGEPREFVTTGPAAVPPSSLCPSRARQLGGPVEIPERDVARCWLLPRGSPRPARRQPAATAKPLAEERWRVRAQLGARVCPRADASVPTKTFAAWLSSLSLACIYLCKALASSWFCTLVGGDMKN